jgi:hypothetical protein
MPLEAPVTTANWLLDSVVMDEPSATVVDEMSNQERRHGSIAIP